MKCAITFCTIFISLCFGVCQSALKTHHIEELCYREYKGEEVLYLKSGQSGILTSVPIEKSSTDCTVKLKPEFGSSVILSLYKYSIDDEDQLTIEDSNGFKVALLGEAEFLDERKTFTSDGILTIRYIRNSNSTLERKSRVKFQFVFTQFHDYPCYYNEFQCKNQRCIRKDLLCDRHNHCGDNSDQENCGRRDDIKPDFPTEVSMTISPGILLFAIVVIIMFIIIIAVLVSTAVARKKKKKNEGPLTTIATSNSPSPTVPEMPSSLITQNIRRPNTSTQTVTKQNTPEVPRSGKHEVPSMYPQIPSSPYYPGVQNPEFNPED